MKNYLLIIWDDEDERNIDLIPPIVFAEPTLADKEHEYAVQYKEGAYDYRDARFNSTRDAKTITIDYPKKLNKGSGCYDGKAVLTFDSIEMKGLPKAKWYNRNEENREPFVSYHVEWIPEGFFAPAGKMSLLKFLIECSGKKLP